MKVYINGFWSGFVEDSLISFSFFKNLFELTFNEEIDIGNKNDSDILFESVFSDKTYINYKKWKFTFFFNGESQQRIINDHFRNNKYRLSQIPNYGCILTGKFTNKTIKVINIPLFIPYIYSNNYINLLQNQSRIDIVPQKNICAVISNSNCPKRNYFLDRLEKRIRIDYAGNFRNNIPKIPGDFNSDEILNFYSQYKFVICLENTKQETYITEKIINGFLAKTIPIYWGSDSICDYFNEERFINVTNLIETNIDEAINKIISIINNDNEYLKMVNNQIFKNGGLTRNIYHIAEDINNLISL